MIKYLWLHPAGSKGGGAGDAGQMLGEALGRRRKAPGGGGLWVGGGRGVGVRGEAQPRARELALELRVGDLRRAGAEARPERRERRHRRLALLEYEPYCVGVGVEVFIFRCRRLYVF